MAIPVITQSEAIDIFRSEMEQSMRNAKDPEYVVKISNIVDDLDSGNLESSSTEAARKGLFYLRLALGYKQMIDNPERGNADTAENKRLHEEEMAQAQKFIGVYMAMTSI